MNKNFFVTRNDGKKIAVRMIEASKDNACPTIIFAHGFGGNSREILPHGEGFDKAGFNCVFFDFCGGGPESESDGSIQEMTVETEKEDLRAIINEISKMPNVDSSRLYLQGESMGGFVSSCIAAEMPEKIRGLVLWYPAFVLPEDAKKRYEAGEKTCFGLQLNERFDDIAKNIDIYDVISRYRGPVLLIHGSADPIVHPDYSKRAMDVFENAEYLELPGAGHGFSGEQCDQAVEHSLAFVTKIEKGAKTR